MQTDTKVIDLEYLKPCSPCSWESEPGSESHSDPSSESYSTLLDKKAASGSIAN